MEVITGGGTSVSQTEGQATKGRYYGITWRAIVLGVLLIPPNSYWIMYVEGIRHSGHPTAISLFWNVVFTLLVLVLLNLVVKKAAPRYALTQPEFITIFAMLTMASALAGHDSLQLGIPNLPGVAYYANADNRYNEILRMPGWLTVTDPDAATAFFLGHDTFYKKRYILAWLGPTLWWTLFTVVLGAVTIAINIVMRKQWTENERLSFPIVQLPMTITENGGNVPFFRNKLLWVGIALGAGLDILNGLHTLYPNIPTIPVRHDDRDIALAFTSPPWNSIGWTPLPLYPFLIALGFLLPLDLSFSVWFFYVFRKLQHLMLAIYPVPTNPRMPYFAQQSFGAWFVYFAFAMWMARGHLKGVWRRVLGRPDGVDDSTEPVTYRTAVLVVVGGAIFLCIFAWQAGIPLAATLPYFAIYFLLVTAISRMRAELGPPAHEMAFGMDAASIIGTVVGTKVLGAGMFSVVPLMYWFTGRGYRTTFVPGQIEGFKMATLARTSPRRLGWAMLLAIGLGVIAAYWAALTLQYQIGSLPGGMVEHNSGLWGAMVERIRNPEGPDKTGILFIFLGAAFTAFLFAMRHAFIWWPFHPAGYALSTAYGVEYFWSCLLIASALKWLVLRWGGLPTYRRALPLMFGVILGEYCVGAFWSVVSVILRQATYDFAPG